MGADLYIDSIQDKLRGKYWPLFMDAVNRRDSFLQDHEERKIWQEKVEKYFAKMYSKGYFRDSYNATSLFDILDLSWWKITDDKNIYTNGFITLKGCKKILKMIETRKLPSRAAMEKYLLRNADIVVDDNKNSLKEWRKMFIQKKRNLINLLKTAIKLKEQVRCSV